MQRKTWAKENLYKANFANVDLYDRKCKNKKGSVYSFDDYSRMCLNQDKLDGIIINPYHKERSIVLNKDVIQHIRTIKEKNIKTYAKAKSYLKDRKRRQKYEIDYES